MNRRLLRYGLIALTLLVACLVPLSGECGQPSRYTVLIDPAHGGEDAGVVADKLREKDLTMNLALLIREESQKVENLQVRLTRSTDRTMTVPERIKAAGDFKPDCLISLHVNGGFGKQASGYEVYFPGFRQNASREEGSSPVLKDMVKNRILNDSVRLAQQIQAALETVFPRKGRGLRDAPNPLLSGVTIPGLVVEVGFATNPEERKKLTAEGTQRAVARALVKGLRDYFRKAP
ncbi:MAG: N-acetylmuramoyl-L-alanine amidase [Proteobacteria bacterium]|nr:N-acetylmuramoyl-L-alanine amidase [Pseudomonadota bacterium]